jgi:hypothetical protein
MLSTLGASMQAPMSMFLGAMSSLLSNLAGVMESLKTQKEAVEAGSTS